MDEEKLIDPRYLEELRKYPASGHKDNDDTMALAMAGQAVFHPDSPFVSIESRSHVNTMPEMPHDDAQDAAALAIPPMAGIIGAAASILNPKLKDAHVEIPRKPDVFRPTKAMLDILSEQIDETAKQNKCPYCNGKLGLEADFTLTHRLAKTKAEKPPFAWKPSNKRFTFQ